MSKIKKNILSIAIAIILVMFIAYGINVFYKSPKYDDYCNYTRIVKEPLSFESCEDAGGRWYPDAPEAPKMVDESGNFTVSGWCDLYYECQDEFDNVREVYNRDVFFISLVLGLIAVIIGGVVLKLESVSVGIMGGGILTIIYGTIRYWGDMSDVYRFIILGVVLAILIWMGYKKIKA